MDVIARAQQTDAQFRDQAIAAARISGSDNSRYASADTCGWCGEEIPEARRQAVPGCDLCAQCQSQKEHLKERR